MAKTQQATPKKARVRGNNKAAILGLDILKWTIDTIKQGPELWQDYKMVADPESGATVRRDCRKLRELSLGMVSCNDSHEFYRICRHAAPVGIVLEDYDENRWHHTFEDFRALERESREIAAGRGIPIRIGTYSSIANAWLPDILSKYEERHPEISFEIMVSSDKLAKWLSKGKVDMLLADEELGAGFRWFPIMQDEYMAAVPIGSVIAQRSAITEDELQKYPMIVSMMSSYRRYREASGKNEQRVIRVSTDDDTTIIRMVGRGLGVSVIAGLSSEDVPANVRVIPLDPPVYRTIGVALPEQPLQAVKAFADYLVKNERRAMDRPTAR